MSKSITIGDIVYTTGVAINGRYGVITGMSVAWRTSSGKKEPIYFMRYVDGNTGLLMKCPDARCAFGCVICSKYVWPESIDKFSKEVVAVYVEAGMIHPSIVK